MNLFKKILPCVVLAVAVLLGLYLLPTAAQAATEGYYTYSISNGKATITDCSTKISGDVTIPDTLGGYPVTSIGIYAFYDCSSLTSITIPDSVTSIGDYAFYDCSSLTSITIPDGVTSIGDWAFSGCSSLTSINIPAGVTSISEYAFYGCSNLTSITIPDGVKSIGNYAFLDCTSLTSITIPDSVTSIGYYAFWNCSSLTSITIPDSVTYIGSSAFDKRSGPTNVYITDLAAWLKISFGGSYANPLQNAGGTLYVNGEPLTHAELPTGLTEIPNYAFSGCTSITSITIPDGVTSIGDWAFSGCSSLTSINIPEGVTSISDYAFCGCSSLTSITIPDSVTSIGSGAFSDCSSLTSITIPDSVTSIGSDAFYNCSSLKTVYYAGSKDQWKQIRIGYDNSRLTNADIQYNHVHDYTIIPPVTVPATCIENGYIEYTCAYGDTYRQVLPATGHEAVTVLRKVEPTCTEAGYTQNKCHCGEVFNTDYEGASGHNITTAQSVVPPTCLEQGYTLYGCTRCDGTEKRDFTEALGHKMVQAPAVAPGCTKPGLTVGTKCERCPLVGIAQKEIPAVGHQLVDGICVKCTYDLTGDEMVTDGDAVYLLRHTLFPEDYPLSKTVDFNADGILSDGDAVYLLRHTLFPEDYPLFPQK